MSNIISQKQIKEIFDDFVEKNEIETGEKKSFEGFLKFLEIDLYDWIKENLRCYFRE